MGSEALVRGDYAAGMSALALASSSPRRRDLLEAVGVRPEVLPADIEEVRRVGEAPRDYVARLAEEKAAAIAGRAEMADRFVLGADTVVVLGDEVLEKPTSRADGRRMLAMLATAKKHEVLTGVAVIGEGRAAVAVDATAVWFGDLSDDDIEAYLDTGEYEGKAGAYAIQGRGSLLVDRIEGSFPGVVGLPVVVVDELLRTFGRRLRDFM